MGVQSGTVPADKVRAIIDQANQEYHVIGAMSFGEVPEGHSVTLNVLRANPDPKNGGDVYDVGLGKYGLTGNFLNALADAAGVSTVSSTLLTYVTNYCVAEVTVARLGLDGRTRKATSRKVMDLREGSGQLKAMRDAAKEKNKDASSQIREQRLRIAEHADSKARLRAIRSLLSVRTYTQEELKKPFAVFTLQFLPQNTRDPELKRIFAVGLMQASLGAMGALYGASQSVGPSFGLSMGPTPAGLLGSGQGPSMGGIPPVDGTVPEDDDPPAGGDDGPPPAPKKIAAGDPQKIFMPGRKGEVPSIWNAPTEDIVKAERIAREKMLGGKWDDRFRDSNLRQLLTMRQELRERGGVDVPLCPELGDDPPTGPRGGGGSPKEEPKPTEQPKAAPTNGGGEKPAEQPMRRPASYGRPNGNGQKPPSDKGAPADARTADQKLADEAFGPSDGDGDEYHGDD